MGTLNIYFEDEQGTRTTVFTKTGNQGNHWHTEGMVSQATDGLKVIFEAVLGSGSKSDMALDDVWLRPWTVCGCRDDENPCAFGTCDSAFNSMTYTCSCDQGFTRTNCDVLTEYGIIGCNGEPNEYCVLEQEIQTDDFDWIFTNELLHLVPVPEAAKVGTVFMFIESSSPRQDNDKAIMVTNMSLPKVDRCLRFWYHMYGSTMGTLNVYTENAQETRVQIFTMSGDQGNQWNESAIFIPAMDDLKVATPSSRTGPDMAYSREYFAFTEASSPRQPNDVATLTTSTFKLPDAPLCMQYHYHMYSEPGSLVIKAGERGNIDNQIEIWTGNQDEQWHQSIVQIPQLSDAVISIQGIRGPTSKGDIGLDLITLQKGLCSNIDKCVQSPCTNGGQCSNNYNDNTFTCTCTSGWVGDTCQLQDTTTGTTFTCEFTPGEHECVFTNTQTGDDFDWTFTNISIRGIRGPTSKGDIGLDLITLQKGLCSSLCGSFPCQNAGLCTGNQDGSYQCSCKTGFAGSNVNKRSETSISCDFEDNEVGCIFENDLNSDNFDWRRRSGRTSSSGTGPTIGAASGSNYMYTEASSPRVEGDFAVLETHNYRLKDSAYCLTLSINMRGQPGQLVISAKERTGNWHVEASYLGHQGDNWFIANIDISQISDPVIAITGFIGSTSKGDIAVDNSVLTEGQYEFFIYAEDLNVELLLPAINFKNADHF
ncbi:unnamed protein product [Mytilus edulis]|uniref:Uncharacterized protein n=1 Tax=Mytilus edulis TaxID=6550 RepID=A0A8S3PTE4_MYTED|nr:unnamed protein product [Mytilus edulis]